MSDAGCVIESITEVKELRHHKPWSRPSTSVQRIVFLRACS
jgi:hypothetical protein